MLRNGGNAIWGDRTDIKSNNVIDNITIQNFKKIIASSLLGIDSPFWERTLFHHNPRTLWAFLGFFAGGAGKKKLQK